MMVGNARHKLSFAVRESECIIRYYKPSGVSSDASEGSGEMDSKKGFSSSFLMPLTHCPTVPRGVPTISAISRIFIPRILNSVAIDFLGSVPDSSRTRFFAISSFSRNLAQTSAWQEDVFDMCLK